MLRQSALAAQAENLGSRIITRAYIGALSMGIRPIWLATVVRAIARLRSARVSNHLPAGLEANVTSARSVGARQSTGSSWQNHGSMYSKAADQPHFE